MANRFTSKASDWDLVNEINKDILNDYILECKAQGKKNSTIYQYERDLHLFFIYIYNYCNNKAITEFQKKDFRDFLVYAEQTLEWSNARTNRIMSSIRNLLYFLEDEDDYNYTSNQARSFKSLPKQPVRNIVFISDDVILKLYNKLMEKEQYMDATLLALAYESGARKSELAQVLRSSIRDDRNNTNIVVGKRGKKFPLIYFNLTKKAFKKYLEQLGKLGENDDNELLFKSRSGKPIVASTLYTIVVSWRSLLKEITGRDLKINVHSLRHSALQNYSDGTHEVCRQKKIKNISIDKLRAIAKHSDSNITQSYLKSQDEKQLEDLFNIKLEYD